MTGETLESTRRVVRQLCDENLITDDKCDKIKMLYTETRDTYVEAGNMLVTVNGMINSIDTTMRIIKKEIGEAE